MKVIQITGHERPDLGKGAAKRLRRKGYAPGVLYGHGGEAIHFYAELPALHATSYTTCFVDLSLAGTTYRCIIRDKQPDPITDLVKHVDCYKISDDKPIVMEIPVTFVGTAPGVLKGGLLVKKLYKLKARAFPKDMPDKIAVDVSGLELGATIRVSEIACEGFAVLNQPFLPVAMVEIPRALRSKGATAEGATKGTKKK